MRFSNRGRFLPRRALPSQRLASWEPRTAHARADGAQNGGASRTPVLLSRCVFPSLSSASVLGALLLSPSLTIVRSPAATSVRPVWYGPRDATQYGVIAPFPLVTTSSRRGMEATALRSVFW